MRDYTLKNPFLDRQETQEAQEAEPPPTAQSRRVLTVSELTHRIQMLLEEAFPSVWVQGEVSQPTISTKGHLYFSLKDSQALIKCVIWRDARENIRFNLEHGLQVICGGRVSLYAPRGDYQLYVETVEPKGIGALQLAFEQLKEKLQKEGLFEESRKRPLPVYPQRIGVVTSPTGAAIQDILKILQGRGDLLGRLQVLLRPVRVQGEGAAEAVAQGIRDLNHWEGMDLIIVGRGGGSLEDLWAFNEERVARAIAASKAPVISAVGHERDYTISDFVADFRAPTPTKAAEMVISQRQAALDRLLSLLDDPAFAEPEEWLKEAWEQLEEKEELLLEGIREPLTAAAHRAQLLHGELMSLSPQAFILHQSERLHRLHRILESDTIHQLEQILSRIQGLAGRLNALSPLAILERGYSITFDEGGRIIRQATAVKHGEAIRTQLHEGELVSRVEERKESSHGSQSNQGNV